MLLLAQPLLATRSPPAVVVEDPFPCTVNVAVKAGPVEQAVLKGPARLSIRGTVRAVLSFL